MARRQRQCCVRDRFIGCAVAVSVLLSISRFTSQGSEAIVSEITRTAPNTAERRIALSSVIAIPVLDAEPSNIQEAGFANDVEGVLGDARNALKILPNKFWFSAIRSSIRCNYITNISITQRYKKSPVKLMTRHTA